MVVGTLLAAGLAAYHGYNAVRGYQKYRAYEDMGRDYYKNTGRHVKYPALRSYQSIGRDHLVNGLYSGVKAGYTGMGMYNSYRRSTSNDPSKV